MSGYSSRSTGTAVLKKSDLDLPSQEYRNAHRRSPSVVAIVPWPTQRSREHLPRFVDPEEGRITIDGRDLREFRQEDVRRTFALAGQEA